METSVDTVAAAFYTSWVARFGVPATITTDRGSQFESFLFQALTNLLGVTRIRTAAYHPAWNGIIERWHRSIKAAIHCHGNQEWVDVLPTILLGLRSSFKKDIKATNKELVYGTTLRQPSETFLDEKMPPDPQIFVERFREHMRFSLSVHHTKRKPFPHFSLAVTSLLGLTPSRGH